MATKKTAIKNTATAVATPSATKENYKQPHEIMVSSNVLNAVGIATWGKFAGEPDFPALIKNLDEQADEVQGGDMSEIEGMLFRQAKTLEVIFTNLARRAASNENLKPFQLNLTLALKAQAQCRATLEALAEVKNPRAVAFVKQANISNGPQQVNNGVQPITEGAQQLARTATFSSEPSKLLEADHGQRMFNVR